MLLNTVKFLIIFCLLIISLQARSQTSMCSNLFTKLEKPSELEIEKKLSLLAREYFSNIRLEEGSETSDHQIRVANIQLSKEIPDDNKKRNELRDAYFKMLKLNSYLRENDKVLSDKEKTDTYNRYHQVLTGIILASSEILKDHGINHTIKYNSARPYLLIDTDGNHFINQTVKRLKEKYNLTIVINGFDILKWNSNGLYWGADKDKREIYLSPLILTKKSFFQDENLLHEFTHNLNFNEYYNGNIKPYHKKIKVKDSAKYLPIYGDSFSVDEIKSFRTSLRVYGHEALSANSEVVINYWFDLIRTKINFAIDFSTLTKEASQEQQSGVDPSVRKFEVQDIDGNVSTVDLMPMFQMASFTESFYRLLGEELTKAEKKSLAEKKDFLQKFIKALSLSQVKKMEGPFPSLDEIKQTTHF